MYCLSVSLFLSVSPLCPLPEQCLSWTVSPSFTWDFRLVVCFFRINMSVAVHLALNVTNQSASHLPPPTTVWFVWLLFARFYMLRFWQFSLPYATWYKGDKCCCFVQLKGSNWLALYPRHFRAEPERERKRVEGRQVAMMAEQGLDGRWCLCILFLHFFNFVVSGSKNGMYRICFVFLSWIDEVYLIE